MNKKSWNIPEDCKEEIREMYADGLVIRNIAWYIGVSSAAVFNIVEPEKASAYRAKRWAAMPEEKKEKHRAVNREFLEKNKDRYKWSNLSTEAKAKRYEAQKKWALNNPEKAQAAYKKAAAKHNAKRKTLRALKKKELAERVIARAREIGLIF